MLLAGLDPTGYGGVIAGFGDQREVELLVEAGFTPLEALHIATSNGAEFLGEADKIGTAAPYNAIAVPPGTQVAADTANAVTIQCSGVKLKLIPVKANIAAFKVLEGKPGYVPPESIKLSNN